MSKQILLATCIIIFLMGCSPDKRGMARDDDIMMLYTSIDDNSEIITVEIRDKALHLEIKSEKHTKLTKRIIPYRDGDLLSFEYKKLSRMPGVAMFHFVRKPLDVEHVKMNNIKLPVPNNSEKFGKLPNAFTLRLGDRLFIYSKKPTNWLPIMNNLSVTNVKVENSVLHAKIKRDQIGLSSKKIKLPLKDLNKHEKLVIPKNVSFSGVGDILIFELPIMIDIRE